MRFLCKSVRLLFLTCSMYGAVACAGTQDRITVPDDIKMVMLLLTGSKQPTEADYLKYFDSGDEIELSLLLKQCKAEGASDCVKISNVEAESPHAYASRLLVWIRNCYGTVGSEWQVTDSKSITNPDHSDQRIGEIYDVRLKSHIFSLQYISPTNRNYGSAVAITRINNEDLSELIAEDAPGCPSKNKLK